VRVLLQHGAEALAKNNKTRPNLSPEAGPSQALAEAGAFEEAGGDGEEQGGEARERGHQVER